MGAIYSIGEPIMRGHPAAPGIRSTAAYRPLTTPPPDSISGSAAAQVGLATGWG